jgi:predicted dehydrogenase
MAIRSACTSTTTVRTLGRAGSTGSRSRRTESGVVAAGARHFVACLRDGTEPVLTAEHARHVLEVTLAAYASIADGRSHAIKTAF